jgi:putative endonuclease
MYTVYILKSLKDSRTYVGYSFDVNKRLEEHNSGKVSATKNRIPFKILFTELTETLENAKERELYWKSGTGRRAMKKLFS